MKRLPALAAALAFFPVAATTCPAGAAPADADTKEIAEAVNAFAFDLYGQLRGREGNLFLSPYSIETALAMTYAGARGQTADQMAGVLHLPVDLRWEPDSAQGGRIVLRDQQAPWPADRLHGAFAALQNDLNAAGKGEAFQLTVANRLWGQKGYEFLPEFLGLLEQHYGAGLEQVDFAGATEAARKTINAWVERETRDKIRDLLKPDVLDGLTRLVLTNAIYFKGHWTEEFDKKLTREEDFFVSPDRTVKAPLMHRTDMFGYFGDDDLQALELPYKGDRLSMVVLLPTAKDGLGALETSVSAKMVAGVVKKLRRREVAVTLPKFKTTAEFSLAQVLAAMGMQAAFEAGKADFSGMDGKKDLFISAVVHKAFVEVNEEGMEAAAATGLSELFGLAPPPAEFRADHPFLYLIRDRETGAILFLGRLVDPSTGGE